MLKSYCIGHVQPTFAIPIPFQMLCPRPLGLANEIVIEDNRFGPGIDGGSLAEYSQLFGLCEMILSGDIVTDKLFLFQYRKFLSPKDGGEKSKDPWIYALDSFEAIKIFPNQNDLESVSARIIVGSVYDFGVTTAAKYAVLHVIDDFVFFIAACARSPFLTEKDIFSFVTFRGIIPSPSLCFISSDLFVKIMQILKSVWSEFYPNYFIKRDGYQRRSAGYLLERLHSFLITKWLLEGREPDVKVWRRYILKID